MSELYEIHKELYDIRTEMGKKGRARVLFSAATGVWVVERRKWECQLERLAFSATEADAVKLARDFVGVACHE
jgi:hypothetical protein